MSDTPTMMLAGLGNPGTQYTRTRHNIGFRVLDKISDIFSIPFNKSRFDSIYSKGIINGKKIILAKPQSFMNKSGFPIQKLSSYFKIKTSDIIIVHDDMDLNLGKIKLVKNRGHGGHNGIKSIMDALGTKDFIRVRIGIGRPHGQRDVISHVLTTFSKEEEKLLETITEKSVEACEIILEQGIKKAMTQCNQSS